MEKGRLDVKSPCTQNCCLDETDTCLGCYRVLPEILGWSASSQEEKRSILVQCKSRKTKKENLNKF